MHEVERFFILYIIRFATMPAMALATRLRSALKGLASTVGGFVVAALEAFRKRLLLLTKYN